MGSDNNGYLYVQDINGQMFVSQEDISGREMTEFVPIEDVLKEVSEQ